jgi:hypothetical protein
VKHRLKEAGAQLRARSMSEHVRLGMRLSIALSDDLRSVLDGEMLGDGHLYSPAGFQAYFSESVGNDKKEWLEYVIKQFRDSDMVVKDRYPYFRKNKPGWGFATCSTVELGEQHRRWYVGNSHFDPLKPRSFSNRRFIKMVPHDVVLDKRSMLHWFVGDGAVKCGGGSKLCTHGFSHDEIEFLRFRLAERFGIKTSHLAEGAIGLPKVELKKILDVIGLCPVECYVYKWDIDMTRQHAPRNDSIDMAAVERFMDRRKSF